MTAIPAGRPAPDTSGGVMVIRYRVGATPVTFSRYHIAPFSSTTYAYAGGSGTEANIPATFDALVTLISALFATDTDIALTSLWQRVGSDFQKVPVCVDDLGDYHHHAGVNVGTASLVDGYTQNIFNFTSVNDHTRRTRVRVVSSVDFPCAADKWYRGDPAGDDLQKLVAYLTGPDTNIEGRDGHRLATPVHSTSCLVANLRRKSLLT